MNNHQLKRDIFLLLLSIAIAILIARSGIVGLFLEKIESFRFIASFFAGVFFVSIFTIAPAISVLFFLFQTGSVFEVSLLAALGAVVGDYLIFRFFRNLRSLQFETLFQKIRPERIRFLFHSGLAWLVPLLGAIVIASPLPDEIGLALLGFSRFPTGLLIPLSFVLNFVGIFILGLITKQF